MELSQDFKAKTRHWWHFTRMVGCDFVAQIGLTEVHGDWRGNEGKRGAYVRVMHEHNCR
jgi:hypothetical protein